MVYNIKIIPTCNMIKGNVLINNGLLKKATEINNKPVRTELVIIIAKIVCS